MKRFLLVLLVLLLLGMPGCGKEQVNPGTTETIYHSDTSSQDCYLCGDGIANLVPFYWGQKNIALISLNTFDIKPIEINRYDRVTGQLIKEYAGTVSFGGGGSSDGGFSASLLLDYDRGHAKAVHPSLQERLDRGDLGYKTGVGYYDWRERDMDAFRKKTSAPYLRFFNWKLPESV